MKKVMILLILIIVSVSAFAAKQTLVAKKWKYEVCPEWDDFGGKRAHNRKVMDSAYRYLMSRSQFIKIDSLVWDSLRIKEVENKNYIFVDEISVHDHRDYWEVSLAVNGEVTKIPVNFKSYWDVDTYVIHNFEKLREKLIERKNISLEEEKVVQPTPVYTPKWTPKFIREQDRKRKHRN